MITLEEPLNELTVDGLVINRESIVPDRFSGDNANWSVEVYPSNGCIFLDLFELEHWVLTRANFLGRYAG